MPGCCLQGLTVCTLPQAIDVLGPLVAGPKQLAERES